MHHLRLTTFYTFKAKSAVNSSITSTTKQPRGGRKLTRTRKMRMSIHLVSLPNKVYIPWVLLPQASSATLLSCHGSRANLHSSGTSCDRIAPHGLAGRGQKKTPDGSLGRSLLDPSGFFPGRTAHGSALLLVPNNQHQLPREVIPFLEMCVAFPYTALARS